MTQIYTTDTKFLQQYQKYIKEFPSIECLKYHHNFCLDFYESFNQLTSMPNDHFHETFMYVEWSFAKHLNYNEYFLYILCFINFISPLLTILSPIFVVIPLVLLVISGNACCSVDMLADKIYTCVDTKTSFSRIIVSALFYAYNIYQNVRVCIKFYTCLKKMRDMIADLREFIITSMHLYDAFIKIEFTSMNVELLYHKEVLEQLLPSLPEFNDMLSYAFVKDTGRLLKMFYTLYSNTQIKESITYTCELLTYYLILKNISVDIQQGKLCAAEYSEKDNKECNINIIDMYYPKYIRDIHNNDKIIKTSLDMDSNILLSGPNSAGKTTFSKTLYINLLLSQQIGYGCYKSLKFTPYTHFHIYMNVPDTSGKDGLFQAEVRKSKEILDSVKENVKDVKNEKHFCIFDELYSGTNYEDSVSCSYKYIQKLSKYNIDFIITTHLSKLCKKIEAKQLNTITNYQMIEYKPVKGCSNIKSGVKVFNEIMNE